MADDEPRPLLDPRLFAPSEFLGEDMDHNVDVTGETNIEVTHDVDVDLPYRRIQFAAIAFAAIVVALGLATPVGATVQLAGALGIVLIANLLL